MVLWGKFSKNPSNKLVCTQFTQGCMASHFLLSQYRINLQPLLFGDGDTVIVTRACDFTGINPWYINKGYQYCWCCKINCKTDCYTSERRIPPDASVGYSGVDGGCMPSCAEKVCSAQAA